jgi:6-phosphogluconate dehydrogenase
MKLGLIGLGKMGGNMVKRLINDGHEIAAFDLNKDNVNQAVVDGAEGAASIEDLVKKISAPRNVWIMVPHGEPTENTISKLIEQLDKNDLIVDGGNSNYKSSMKNSERCNQKGIKFMDCGVSGGIWGLKIGYNLMIGGSEQDYKRMEPIFKSLAPENGYALVGKNGAGHFVKMIHNALEYVMLEGMGEAFECMYRSDFNVDLQQVASLWSNGSVVRSWLMELAARTFKEENNNLEKIAPFVDDSGTARWTTDYAVENAVPVPTITMSLYKRFASRLDEPFSDKVIAALRNQFGGHAMKEELVHGK